MGSGRERWEGLWDKSGGGRRGLGRGNSVRNFMLHHLATLDGRYSSDIWCIQKKWCRYDAVVDLYLEKRSFFYYFTVMVRVTRVNRGSTVRDSVKIS